jgi:hypothetical protein
MVTVVQGSKMKASKNFAVFILSHGRPDNIITYQTLRKCGYTGRIVIVCDDEDKTLAEYKKRYKDEVVVFSKSAYSGKFDIMDNFSGNKVIVYARNACYDIARDLGLDYFFEYEDDYTNFQYRFVDGKALRGITIRKLDDVLDLMIECLDETKANTIAFSQGGDFIGGAGAFKNNTLKRKAMNSFVFKVNEDPKDDILFIGRMNDDVNTYLTQGKVGKLFFQFAPINLVQLATQSNAGGNTEAYKSFGTYVKSFYSVMAEPSCCKIDLMGRTNKRIHHKINWKHAVPKILDANVKKH